MAKKIKSEAQIIKEYLPTPSELIEDFEDTGYLKPQEARELIEALYLDDIVPISKTEFVNMAMKKLEGHHLYKQFVEGDVKMCSKCKNIKPLKSFRPQKYGMFGVESRCIKCANEYQNEKYRIDPEHREHKKRIAKEYQERNKERIREIKRAYNQRNKAKKNMWQKRDRLKKMLAKCKVENITKDALNQLIFLHDRQNKPQEDKGLIHIELALKYHIELGIDITNVDQEEVEKMCKSKPIEITKKEIEKLRAEGKTFEEIGKIYNASGRSISRIARKLGVQNTSSKYGEYFTMIADCIASNKTYKDIGERIGCSKWSISQLVNSNGGRKAFVEKYKSK